VTGIATPLVTNVLGSDVLTAVIPSTMLNMPGTLNVVVSNPAPGGSSSPSPVAVGASPTIQAVVNAASMQAGTVALGELITLFGNNIGPTTPVVLTDANLDGFADTMIASTSVTVDGIAAPLIYASQNQITVQVPYEATLGAGKVISVSQGASPPSTATVTIGAHAPGLFTADGSGAGQLAALNFSVATSLYSVNSSSSAAKAGDTVLLYLTGEGDYAITISPRTGYLVPTNLLTYPQLSPLPTVTIGGVAAVVNYAGPVPGSILGLIQINAVVPVGAGTGAAIPVVVTIGASTTQAGTTLGLK
jgi:trimeric autotransporter adhesin